MIVNLKIAFCDRQPPDGSRLALAESIGQEQRAAGPAIKTFFNMANRAS
jgi:hypothetical protein